MQLMMNDTRATMKKARRVCVEVLFFYSTVVVNAEFRKIRPATIKI